VVHSDKVYQLLNHGRWFSLSTPPASSITKTGRHDIVEILLKVALNTINQSQSFKNLLFFLFIKEREGKRHVLNKLA
jgi:hypothetical protein